MAQSSPKDVENTVVKRRNCSLRAISPFSTMFSKDLYRWPITDKKVKGLELSRWNYFRIKLHKTCGLILNPYRL